MKILVCFKAVPQVEMFLDEDWTVDDKLRIDTSFVKTALGAYDESALELALKLRDAASASNTTVTLNALTVDGGAATATLKTLLALQFAAAVRIDPRADLHFSPTAVAAVISQYVARRAPQDALLLGGCSDIGENAKTPLLVAEMLGWPCITRVTWIDPVDAKHLTVTSRTDDGHVRQKVRTPVVLSVGDAPGTGLRVPTLKDRLVYGKKGIEVLSAADFQRPAESETLVDLTILRQERAGVCIQGGSPAEKARVLYEKHLKPFWSREKGRGTLF